MSAKHEISVNKEVILRIEEYRRHIETYWSLLNIEGIWLFLATLGCWSVSHHWFQLAAFIITAILFGYRIKEKCAGKRRFPAISKQLEEMIRTELQEGDIRKARLYDLAEVQTKQLSLYNTVKSTLIFLICYGYLAASFIYAI